MTLKPTAREIADEIAENLWRNGFDRPTASNLISDAIQAVYDNACVVENEACARIADETVLRLPIPVDQKDYSWTVDCKEVGIKIRARSTKEKGNEGRPTASDQGGADGPAGS